MQGLSNSPYDCSRQGAPQEFGQAGSMRGLKSAHRALASSAEHDHVYEMTRFLTRTVALLLLAAGFAALIVDGVRSIAASRIMVTAFGETAFRLFPHSFPKLQTAVEQKLHPVVWDPFLLSFFLTPAWIVLGFLALVLFWLARRRRGVGVDPG
jgi:hypothetical protein